MQIRFTFFLAASISFFAPNHADSQEAVTKELVDSLVEQLASTNPIPRERKGSTAEYPPGYDKKRQSSVFAAYGKLAGLHEAAFPFLIEHFDDTRYALTADAGPMDKNFTVGRLCYLIVELQIQPDKGWSAGEGDPRFRKFRPHYPTHIQLRDKTKAKEWWESSRDKTLQKIQIEAIEWMIAVESEDTEYSEFERKTLQERLQALRSSNQAFPTTIPWSK